MYNLYYFHLAVLFVSFITSTLNWREHKRADSILSLLLLSTIISESIAEILARVLGNNLIVFHFFSPLQFLLVCLYYNNTIISFKKYRIGLYIGLLGVLISISNSLYFQNISTFNTFYIQFEALAIIFMTLHYFLEIIRKDKVALLKNKNFWIGVTFLFFWSITYTYWALASVIAKTAPEMYMNTFYILCSINIITYGGLAVIFILNKKNILHNEY